MNAHKEHITKSFELEIRGSKNALIKWNVIENCHMRASPLMDPKFYHIHNLKGIVSLRIFDTQNIRKSSEKYFFFDFGDL